MVKIRVHIGEAGDEDYLEPQSDVEDRLVEFLRNVLEKMGFDAEVNLESREDGRLVFGIQGDNSAVIIGRQGKTLDAFQLLANIYAGRISESKIRVVVDAEDYRKRRERQLVRMANRVAEQVRKSRRSKLLEAMNPFERRLIHTTLNEQQNVETISEGDGLYKKIRVFYKEE